jgi:hypothetical protein
MLRPAKPDLEELINVQLARETLSAAGITPAERKALLLVPPTLFCRDLHALDQAAVVFLCALSTPYSESDLEQAGAFVYGDYGRNWWANKVSKVEATAADAGSWCSSCLVSPKTDTFCLLMISTCVLTQRGTFVFAAAVL